MMSVLWDSALDILHTERTYRQCFHVVCAEGELLKITGNLIVEISKSKKMVDCKMKLDT